MDVVVVVAICCLGLSSMTLLHIHIKSFRQKKLWAERKINEERVVQKLVQNLGNSFYVRTRTMSAVGERIAIGPSRVEWRRPSLGIGREYPLGVLVIQVLPKDLDFITKRAACFFEDDFAELRKQGRHVTYQIELQEEKNNAGKTV